MNEQNPLEGMTFDDLVSQQDESAISAALQPTPGNAESSERLPAEDFDQLVQMSDDQRNKEYEDDPTYNLLMGRAQADNTNSLLEDNRGSQLAAEAILTGQPFSEAKDLASDEQKKAAAEQQKKARAELAGSPSGFVSGRDQIPYVENTLEENPTKENLRKRIEEGNYDFRHKLKLFGEEAVMTLPDLVDFLRNAPHTFNFMNLFGEGVAKPFTGTIEVDGQKIELGPDYHKQVEGLIKDTYSVLGINPELEKVESTSDAFLALTAQNLAPSAQVALVRKGIDTVGKVPSQLSKFMKGELGISLSGAGVGTAGYAITEGSDEDKWGAAQIGNMLGVFGSPVIAHLPLAKAGWDIAKKATKSAELFNSENAYDLAQTTVHRHLATFVPEAELPRVNQRMELVRRVQKMEPDFKPTVGNIIGTEEARMVQRVTDTKNYNRASEQYVKTKAAVDRLTERYRREDLDPSERSQIAAALQLYSDDALEHARFLSDRISVLERNARSVPNSYVSGAETGQNIRKELDTMKEAYEKVMDDIYKNVDPDGTAKFDARGLISRVKSISEDTSDLDLILDAEDTGYTFIAKTLPKYITKIAKRETNEGQLGDFLAQQGFQLPTTVTKQSAQSLPHLTFDELKKLRTNINKRARMIARQDPGSVAPGILGKIDEEINNLMDQKMLSGDATVRDRYIKATEFARTEFYPRFREGVGGKLERQDPSTGNYFISADEVGPMFWKKGPKETNIEDFQKLFSKEHLDLQGIDNTISDTKLKEVAEGASELAREHLSAYAMRTLQDALDAAPDKNAVKIFQKWQSDYKGVLRSFPEIAKEADVYGEQLARFETQRVARTAKIEKINKEIVEQYSGVNQDTVLKNVFDAESSEEVGKFVEDLYRAGARKTGQNVQNASDPFTLLYPETIAVDMKTPDMVRLNQALKDSVAAELVHRSYSPDLEGPSWAKFDQLLHDHGHKLEQIFDADSMQGLKDYGKALRLLGEENKPLTKRELNAVKATLDSFGFSPASILSRYYSHALGKVGPVYLATDALTRILTGVSSKHFDRVYAETMYDLDGLEQVLKHMGSETSSQVIAETKALLREKGIEGLKQAKKATLATIFSDHMLLKYKRAYDFTEELEKNQQELDKEATKQALLENYLIINDQYTGQASRIMSNIYERDDFGQGDIFTDVENDGDDRSPTEIFNEIFFPKQNNTGGTMSPSNTTTETVPVNPDGAGATEEGRVIIRPDDEKDPQYVASVINDVFTQAGLDPELGLVMAHIESTMGTNLKAGTSSAEGVFQFIDSTWEQMVNRYGDKHGFTMDEADKFDVYQNTAMGVEFLKENTNTLKNAGFEGTPENLYLAHFLGASGAVTFLKGLEKHPGSRVSSSVRPSQIKANKGIFIKGGKQRSLQEVYDLIQQKIDKARSNVQSYLETPEGDNSVAEA